LYMKTEASKVSVFVSQDKQTKMDYLKLTEENAQNIRFKFDHEVDEINLDIAILVLKTSDVNIPSTRYSLDTINQLVERQNQEDRIIEDGFEDGFVYTIIDNNTGITLYNDYYLFSKDKTNFIDELREEKYANTNDKLTKDNLKLILAYYDKEYIKNKEGDDIGL
ncbi:MAG: hypothetical protein IJO27_03470, partial [Bacilli bacterium]|nr:hypothetical protein [Bacilli bacterium]